MCTLHGNNEQTEYVCFKYIEILYLKSQNYSVVETISRSKDTWNFPIFFCSETF